MPCYRCAARQTDPVRGASPWRRAVVGGEQVLFCPACQRDSDWQAGLDRCASCGSIRLAKALGLVVCRDCGTRTSPLAAPSPPAGTASGTSGGPADGGAPGAGAAGGAPEQRGQDLASEVAAALARMFGRERDRPADGPAPPRHPAAP